MLLLADALKSNTKLAVMMYGNNEKEKKTNNKMMKRLLYCFNINIFIVISQVNRP